VLAEAAEAFFPTTALSVATLEKAQQLIDAPDLDAPLRRRLTDVTDTLRRHLAIASAFPKGGDSVTS
jgi:hypothetical protein